ncbi:MAG: peptidylprolyl isomerase [Desulfobacteraceae bacterium]|nr:MAG: peptidylprolyl isomerase [Desulfobacteraceae bacterium]
MNFAKGGDTIKVHYTGRLTDGTIFDSSKKRNPLEFRIGSGSLIPGFENGIIGMAVGDTKTVTIPDNEGYGPKNEDLVVQVKRENLPDDIAPEIGQMLQMSQPDGHFLNVMVTEVDALSVTLDANHPLAGKTLLFEIELIEIL